MTEVYRRHRYLLAFALGALLTAGIPPLGLFPVIFLIFPLQMDLTRQAKNGRTAFLTGWAFGAGYFVIGLYWFVFGFRALYSNYQIRWILPAAIYGPSLYVALFYAAASLAAYQFRRSPVLYALAYSVFLFWAEYIRGHDPVNFPWNLIGSVWYHVLPVLQSLSLFGIYGLTLLTLLWATIPFLMLRRGSTKAIILIAATFVLTFGWGALRLLQAGSVPSRPGLAVQILQPNITQEVKKEDAFARHLTLMRNYPPQSAATTLSIWPETVFDVKSGEPVPQYAKIAALLPKGGYAIVGVHRFVPRQKSGKDTHADLFNREAVYNSLVVIDRKGNALATYDKAALAPWGEYVPYERLIRKTFLRKYLFGFTRLTAGPGPQTLRLKNLPAFSPMICYEITFPDRAYPRNDRPDFILSLSDDVWTSGTVGPWQSFGFTRMRAIEEGLPVLRAANIGISAIIDPYGRELMRLDMHATGVLNGALPQPLAPTVFARYHDVPLMALAIFMTLCCIVYINDFGKNQEIRVRR